MGRTDETENGLALLADVPSHGWAKAAVRLLGGRHILEA
jgi:hypothetical protein